ncbi:recombinase family protein [Trichocoleus desertorum AS-A10]|uniref:recombinase family protein n=1 Tax=Trichocoleus desertorum TaxID=1481672 RepID=UPI003298B5D2
MTIRAALYFLRVFTTDKGQETNNQLLQLQEFCDRQGWQIANIYLDRESGRKGKRERGDFSRMCDDAAKRKFDDKTMFVLLHTPQDLKFHILPFENGYLPGLLMAFFAMTVVNSPTMWIFGIFGIVFFHVITISRIVTCTIDQILGKVIIE